MVSTLVTQMQIAVEHGWTQTRSDQFYCRECVENFESQWGPFDPEEDFDEGDYEEIEVADWTHQDYGKLCAEHFRDWSRTRHPVIEELPIP